MPLYPLGLAATTGIIGIVCVFLRKKTSLLFFLISTCILIFFSLPPVANLLMISLEKPYYQMQLPEKHCSAIVLLGGGGVSMSAPRQFPEVNEAGDRMLHAARLYKMGYAPKIITTGTQVGGFESVPEAVQNAMVLAEIGVDSTDILKELKARNTHEHAPNIIKILDSLGLPREIILVTTASHMKRSIIVFKKYGFTVYPAATDFNSINRLFSSTRDFFPVVGALEKSTTAIHEYYGIIGYRLLGWI